METLLAHRTNRFPALEPLENKGDPPGVGKRAAWPSTAGTTAGVPHASVWIRRRRRSCDAKRSRLPVRLWPIFRPCDGPGSSPCARRVHPLCRVLRAPNLPAYVAESLFPYTRSTTCEDTGPTPCIFVLGRTAHQEIVHPPCLGGGGAIPSQSASSCVTM